MAVGSLGEIVFEVSAEKIRTIDNVKRKGSARWAVHEVVGKKPVREFIGPGLESYSFTIQFSVSLGLNPSEELQKLRDLRDEGKTIEFVLGGSPVSANSLWTVDDITETHRRHDAKGNLLFAEVEVSLTEYPKEETVITEAASRTEGESN